MGHEHNGCGVIRCNEENVDVFRVQVIEADQCDINVTNNATNAFDIDSSRIRRRLALLQLTRGGRPRGNGDRAGESIAYDREDFYFEGCRGFKCTVTGLDGNGCISGTHTGWNEVEGIRVGVPATACRGNVYLRDQSRIINRA